MPSFLCFLEAIISSSRYFCYQHPNFFGIFRHLSTSIKYKEDSDFIGWYESATGERGREPDFVLFGNQHGLLALEVKDWLIDQIAEADSHNFKIWIGGW